MYPSSDPALTTWILLRETWSAMYKAAEGKLATVGLTPERTEVLWICRDHPGPLNPAELSRLLFRENQTIAGVLNRMESEGLVRRVPKRKGKPFTDIEITAKGEEACPPAIEVLKELIASIMSSLPGAELEQLQGLLRKLRQDALEELSTVKAAAGARRWRGIER